MNIETVVGLLALATSLIGFVTVWIKAGVVQGRQETMLRVLDEKEKEDRAAIDKLERDASEMRVNVGAFMGKIEAKLDDIKEAIAELKFRGGRHAAEK